MNWEEVVSVAFLVAACAAFIGVSRIIGRDIWGQLMLLAGLLAFGISIHTKYYSEYDFSDDKSETQIQASAPQGNPYRSDR
jgi:hypothetical protein